MKNKYYIILIIICFGFIIFINYLDSKDNIKYVSSKEKIENQFNPWNGSHIELTKIIKLNMNDPDSYEHEKTIYWDMNSYVIVLTNFRGKNMYGGIVKHYVKASFDVDGKLIEVIDQG